MRAKQAIAMMTTAIILVMVIGCATMGRMTPREEILTAIADFQASIMAKDMDKIMRIFSDDFSNSQGATKAMVRSDFEWMASQGALQNITIEGLEKSEIIIDDNSATVTLMIVGTPQGKKTFNCTMKKEADGVWRFVNAEQQ